MKAAAANSKSQSQANTDTAYRILVENLEDYAVFMMDAKGKIKTWNKGAERQFGYSEKEAIGKNFSIIFTKEDKKLGIPQQELKEASSKGRADDERRHVNKKGKAFWCSGVVVKFEDSSGKFIGMSKIVRDISERKKSEETIQHQAMHDPLTGLANRKLMFDQLTIAVESTKKTNEIFALVMIDLDDFKKVNDTLGHDTGDTLLQEVASRLAGSVRQEDTVARFGGDEYVIILRNIKTQIKAKNAIKKILSALQPSYSINNKIIPIKASLGIAMCPVCGKDVVNLMKHADMAMYQTKKLGGNTFTFYKKEAKK